LYFGLGHAVIICVGEKMNRKVILMRRAPLQTISRAGFVGLHLPMFAWLVLFAAFGSALLASCARTNVQPVNESIGQRPLPRPDRFLVFDFAVSPQDVSLDSAVGAKVQRLVGGASQTDEQLKVGQAVANELSFNLVKELRSLGLPAERASSALQPAGNDLVIEGRFLAIEEGNRLRRTVVGFGAGASGVKALVQVYQGSGAHRKLIGEFEATADSSRKPGMGPLTGVGAAAGRAAESVAISGATGIAMETRQTAEADADRMAKEIVRSLSEFFRSQGWI
jgi:hypothetical protein